MRSGDMFKSFDQEMWNEEFVCAICPIVGQGRFEVGGKEFFTAFQIESMDFINGFHGHPSVGLASKLSNYASTLKFVRTVNYASTIPHLIQSIWIGFKNF